jgi:iron complex outermembrane receptor protein
MKYQITRGRLLATTMIAGVATLAGFAANAQTATAPAADPNNEVEAVVVTGSLLRRTDTATPSPVTVQTSEQLKAQGITTVADAIRSLSADNSGSVPAAFGNGFAAGSTGVALRGLTVNSTLVMIDGLRNASYPLADDGQRSFVDLNSIPFNAVERIETLKDGASSLYGADAIGGVVNIIMKSNYQGMGADLSVGTSQHGGGDQYRFNGEIGHGDLDTDKYNMYFDVEYQLDKTIRIDQRGFPFNTFDLSSIPGGTNDNPGAGGSTFYGQIKRATMGTAGDISTGQALAGALWQPLRTCASDSPLTTVAAGSYCAQNTGLFGDVQPKQERIGAYGRFTIKPSDDFQAYLAVSYIQSKTTTNGTPRTISSSTPHNLSNIVLPSRLSNGQLNPNNPFAAEGYDALIRYRFSDLDNHSFYTNHMARMVGGVEGQCEGLGLPGQSRHRPRLAGERAERLHQLQAAAERMNNGTYNFIDPSKNSQAVRDALVPVLAKTSTSDLDSVNFVASREVFNLPGGDAQLGLGGEFRYEAVNDPALNPVNDAQGLGNARTIGNRTVASAYAELGLPVLTSRSQRVGSLRPLFGLRRQFLAEDRRQVHAHQDGRPARHDLEGLPRAVVLGSRATRPARASRTFSFANYPDVHHGPRRQRIHQDVFALEHHHGQSGPEAGEVDQLHDGRRLGSDAQLQRLAGLLSHQEERRDRASQRGHAIAAYYAGEAIPAGYTVVTPTLADPEHAERPAAHPVGRLALHQRRLAATSGIDLSVQNTFYLPADIKWTSNLEATVHARLQVHARRRDV